MNDEPVWDRGQVQASHVRVKIALTHRKTGLRHSTQHGQFVAVESHAAAARGSRTAADRVCTVGVERGSRCTAAQQQFRTFERRAAADKSAQRSTFSAARVWIDSARVSGSTPQTQLSPCKFQGTVVGSPWVKPGLRRGGDQQRRGPRDLPPYTLCSGQTRSHANSRQATQQQCTARTVREPQGSSTAQSRAVLQQSDQNSGSTRTGTHQSHAATVRSAQRQYTVADSTRAAKQQPGLHSSSAQYETGQEPGGST